MTKNVTSHHKSFITIVNCIVVDQKVLKEIFIVLISFLFEYENDKHQKEVAMKILKYLHKLDQDGQNIWEVIVPALKKEMDKYFQITFVAFLRCLLFILNEDTLLIIGWFQEVEKIGPFEAMKSQNDDDFFSRDNTLQ